MKNKKDKHIAKILLLFIVGIGLGFVLGNFYENRADFDLGHHTNNLRASFYAQEVATLESAHGFRKALADGSAQEKFVLVDLRSPEEYKAEHIVTAVNIPAYTEKDNLVHTSKERIINSFKKLKKENPNKEIVVYCYSSACMTGRKIGNMLAQNRIFVKELTVGWNEWRYFPNTWNHVHEWKSTDIKDYIVSGNKPGKPKRGLSPEGCKIGNEFGC